MILWVQIQYKLQFKPHCLFHKEQQTSRSISRHEFRVLQGKMRRDFKFGPHERFEVDFVKDLCNFVVLRSSQHLDDFESSWMR